MANLSKKWGAVIGCWAVALALIVTGICLGLVIPSRAAEDEYHFMVTYGDEVCYCQDLYDGTLNDFLVVIADKPKNTFAIKLLADHYSKSDASLSICATDDYGFDWSLDLNGHILAWPKGAEIATGENYTITLKDSNPSTTRYCVRTGTADDYHYDFYDQLPDGLYGTEIKGGVFVTDDATIGNNSGTIVIDGGNYYGKGGIQNNATGTLMINNANWQIYTNLQEDYFTGHSGLINEFGSVEINGFNTKIYGTILDAEIGENEEDVAMRSIDLSAIPADSRIKLGEGLAFKTETIDGVKVYQAVDAVTGKPVEQPTDPIPDQPANTTNNMVGIIVLGAATVVMIAGVGTAIGIAAKRRKRKVA